MKLEGIAVLPGACCFCVCSMELSITLSCQAGHLPDCICRGWTMQVEGHSHTKRGNTVALSG